MESDERERRMRTDEEIEGSCRVGHITTAYESIATLKAILEVLLDIRAALAPAAARRD